jgi:flagellar motor switch protein FliG
MTIELTGPQKAAVLLVHLGRDRSAQVLKALRETEVEELMAEVARLGDVPSVAVENVLNEFETLAAAHQYQAQGGLDFAREVLEESLGVQRAREVLDRLTASIMDVPFEFLRRADPRQVLTFLQDEHPQTIALVLAHLNSQQAAVVLSGLSDSMQADVAHRIAVMEQTSPEVVRHVEVVLQRKASSLGSTGDVSSTAATGGVQPLVDILSRSDRATEKVILERLEAQDPDLADEVRNRMFVFEDIVGLDDRAVQLVLREIDTKELAVALKGVREDVRNKVLKNMSSRAAESLVDEIEVLGPVRLKTVEEAQTAIVRVIRRLEEGGQIVLSRGGDEFVV